MTVGRLFGFVLGATSGFAIWEAAASRGFRVRLREERSEVVLVAGAQLAVARRYEERHPPREEE